MDANRLRRALRWAALAALAGVLALAGYTLALVPFTPAVDGLLAARDDKPSVLLAADGSLLATFRRTPREWLPLDRIPQHVIDALIATEDHRFWEHPGVDWRRSLSSVAQTLAGDPQGGSTITQQLARNAFPAEIGRARTATRKLKELITAIRLERRYAKREILEAYLNTVSFHYNAIGIEMAARTYFDKPAEKLTVAEGATLIGLLKGTRVYNPVLHPDRALERRNVVLAQMLRHGKLASADFERLKARPLRLDFERQDLGQGIAPHFAEAVKRWLVAWSEPLGVDLYTDGLVVHSAIDPRLQRIANQAVARQLDTLQAVADVEWSRASARPLGGGARAYVAARAKAEPFAHFWATQDALVDAFVRESPEYAALMEEGRAADDALAALRADAAFMARLRDRKTRLEAGFVAVDPRSGAVKAWVGARDHALDAYDHVQRSRRQPGSTFKPFVYGAALEAGIDPQREFDTRGVSLRLTDGTTWRPRDMGAAPDGRSTLEDGLVFSRNSVTAQLIGELGADKVVKLAQRLGVRESPLEAVPSLALGTSPASLLEMTSAYASIAALGEYRAPVLVTKVTDAAGKPLMQVAPPAAAPGERVMDSAVAVQLIDMLRGAVTRGTGQGIRSSWGINADVAGKTGTTQNNTDGWFILMQPQLVAGAWVGFNDPRVTMRSEYWGQGAHNALNVVGDAMRAALAQRLVDERAEFPSPPGAALRDFFRSAGETLRRWFGGGEH